MHRLALWKRACRLRLLPAMIAALTMALALPAGASAQSSPHGTLPLECSTCHTPDSWTMRRGAPFKHEETGFPLIGQHANVRCASCHVGLKFKKGASGCLSCHTDIHRSEMGANCLRCHTQQSWHIPDMLQKHQSTRFSLWAGTAPLPVRSAISMREGSSMLARRRNVMDATGRILQPRPPRAMSRHAFPQTAPSATRSRPCNGVVDFRTS